MDNTSQVRSMVRHALTVRATSALQEVAQCMADNGAEIAVVIAGSAERPTPIGTLTGQDLEHVRKTRANDFSSLRALDVLARRAIVLYEEDTVKSAVQYLRSCDARHALVVGAGGTLAGMVALEDLVAQV